MNKLTAILLVTFLILAALGAAAGYLYLTRTAPTEVPQGTDTQNGGATGSNTTVTTGSGSITNTGASSVQATTGGSTATNDFLHASDTTADPNNEGQYFLAGTGKQQQTAPYNILYVAADQS